MEINELNKNAMGGTELMEKRIRSHVDFDGFQLISSRVRELADDKKSIYWLHDLAGDPEVAHLANDGWTKFHKLVFVSHWQQAMYKEILNVPYNAGVVIPNCVEAAPDYVKKSGEDKVRIIYFSTPHRGLNVAYHVFDLLYKHFGSRIEFNVYSSFDLYGWPQRDEQYKPLFDLCEKHPGINYHKSVSNETIREVLKEQHILCYPSTWQETSCLTLIESMTFGLNCVHSSLGALPETSLGLTSMYNYCEDLNTHAGALYNVMFNAINAELEGNKSLKEVQSLIANISNTKYDVRNVVPSWKALLNQLSV